MMRRVLHVVPYMAEASGGPPVVVRRLVECAQKAHWNTQIVTSPDYCADGGRQLSQEPGVVVLPSQFSALFGEGSAGLEAAIRAADIVHCHTLWSPLVTRAAALARKYQKPYVISPHGMLDPYCFTEKRLKKRAYLEAFERRTLTGASRVLFTAGQERDLAVRTFGAIPNAAVATLGADRLPDEKAALREQFFATHPDLRGRQILMFMGRIHPKKRPALLVDMIKAIQSVFPKAVALFAGTGEDAHLKQVRERVEALKVEDRVWFLGHLSGTAKAAALAAADLFLLPSHQENFAIAVAEALHAGTPVILTKKVNIWQEIVDADAGVAVDEGHLLENLVNAVQVILSNPERQRTMSANASDLARTSFTWDEAWAQTLEVYEAALGKF